MRQGFIYLLRAGIGMLAFATAVAADGLTARGDVLPGDAELEARGAHIGTVTVRVAPIFDMSTAGEDKALFRLANQLHVDTRESTLRAQLLFKSGDLYTRRVLDETERHLRKQRFIREPQIRAVAFHDGLVDVAVRA